MRPTYARERNSGPIAHRCPACGLLQFFADSCSRCGSALVDAEVVVKPEVLAVTTVMRAPTEVLLEPPYAVAIVRLGEDLEVFAIGDPRDEVRAGDVVALESDVVARDDEVAEFWRMRRTGAGEGNQ